MSSKRVDIVQSSRLTTDKLESIISQGVSGDELYEKIQQFQGVSFHDFLINTWAYGYARPKELQAWYIEEIAYGIQEAIDRKSNLSLIMPRGHRKSTIMHGLSIWALLTLPYLQTTVLYLSATEDSAKKHVAELRNAVFRNPKLDFISDRLSENSLNFEIRLPDHSVKLLDYKGVVQLKRGYHLDGVLIMDDIYDDPSDPDSPKQVIKINKMYDTKIKPIPNPNNSSQFLIGTPISKQDLFNIVPHRDYWQHMFYEVFSPQPGTDDETLAPHIVNKQQADNLEKEDWISFQSEYRCIPYYDSQSFLTNEDITNLINEDAKGWDVDRVYPKREDEMVVLGADLGQQRDPTHISVFSVRGTLIRQIHSEYIEQTPYPNQVAYLNQLIEIFNLDYGIIDDTNASLANYGIDKSIYELVIFTQKNKKEFANAFAHLVKTSYNTENLQTHREAFRYNLDYVALYLEFLPDRRQLDQIVVVNKELKSPRNKDGHGDAFFSNALALWWIKNNITTNNQPGIIGGSRFEDLDRNNPKSIELDMNKKINMINEYSATRSIRNYLT